MAVFEVAVLNHNHTWLTKVHRQVYGLCCLSNVARVASSNLKDIMREQPPPSYTQSSSPTIATFKILGDEKATRSEVSHKDEERIAAWAKAEKERVSEWEGSERHRINRARQTCGDVEAEKALERMRKEIASAYERIENERDAALKRAKK